MSNNYDEREKKTLVLKCIFRFIVLISIISLVVFITKSYYTERTYIAKVCEKNINIFKDKSHLFVTIESNGHLKNFVVDNSLLKWRWNSAEDYDKIVVNRTYSFTVIGWRLPLFDLYENIIEFEEM